MKFKYSYLPAEKNTLQNVFCGQKGNESYMKKILSLFLALSMPMANIYAAEAEETLKYSYVIPNVEMVSGRNVIGINQGEIKVVFEGTPKNIDKVTFLDSNGYEPVGGVIKSIDENILSLKFAQLKENEEYILTIPVETGIESEKNIKFQTGNKLLVSEDFQEWEVGDVTPEGTGYMSFSDNPALKVRKDASAVFEIEETEDGDKYLTAANSQKGKDLMIGAEVDDIKRGMIDVKVVSLAGFKEMNAKEAPMNAVGGWWGYCFGGASSEGIRQKEFANFTKDENGFYEAVVTTEKYDTMLNPNDASQAISRIRITAGDLNSDEIVSATGTKTSNKSDSKVVNVAGVKMYPSDDNYVSDKIGLTYYKAGFFTMPEIWGDAEYNGDTYTMTFSFNTDMNPDSFDRITVTDGIKNYERDISYDAQERKIFLTVKDKIYDGYDYSVNIDGAESLDGFKMSDKIDFTHENEADAVISPQIEGEYSYDGETRTLTFNTNVEIDEASVDTIKVIDKRKNREISCDCMYENKKVTVVINEKMYYGCEYEIVLKGVKSTEGFEMKNNLIITHNNPSDELNFIKPEYAIPNPRLRLNIKDGVESYIDFARYIGVNQGYIKLVFDKEVDEKTLDFVTITDSSGTPPKGRILKIAEENTVTLQFGELLPETEYTVRIEPGFAAADGSLLDEPVEYKYMTRPKLFSEEDFSDFAAGIEEHYTDEANTSIALGTKGIEIVRDKNSDISLKTGETENGKKYVDLIENINSKNLMVGWGPMGHSNASNYNPVFTEGEFAAIIEYDIIQAAAGYNGNLSRMHHWNFADRYKGINASYTSEFKKNEDGFMQIQLSAKKYDTVEAGVNEAGAVLYNTKYYAGAYDMLGKKKLYAENEMNNSIDAAKIETYSLAQTYTNGGEPGYKGNGIRIGYIKCGLFTIPKLIGNPEYNRDEATVKYYINTDLDAASVKNIKLYDEKSGEVIETNAVYDENERMITLTLSEALGYQANYITDFSGVKSADGFVFEEENTFRNLFTIEDIIEDVEITNDFESAYLSIFFKNAVSAEKKDMEIYAPDGNPVDFEMNMNGNTMTLKFKNNFDYKNNYSLVINKNIKNLANPGISFEKDAQYNFTLHDIFSVNGLNCSKSGTTLNCSATIANNMEDSEVETLVTAAVFNKDGRLIASEFNFYKIAPLGESAVKYNFENIEDAACVKIYALSRNPELKTLYKEITKNLE